MRHVQARAAGVGDMEGLTAALTRIEGPVALPTPCGSSQQPEEAIVFRSSSQRPKEATVHRSSSLRPKEPILPRSSSQQREEAIVSRSSFQRPEEAKERVKLTCIRPYTTHVLQIRALVDSFKPKVLPESIKAILALDLETLQSKEMAEVGPLSPNCSHLFMKLNKLTS